MTNGANALEVIDLKPLGNSPLNVQNNGGIYEITSSSPGIWYVLYTIRGCNNKMHTMRAGVIFDQCLECDDDYCENLLCIDDFENLVDQGHQNLGYPFIYSGGDNNSPDIVQFSGNNALYLGDFSNGTESIALELKNSIEPNCAIKFNLDVRIVGGGMSGTLNVWGSEQPPCDVLDAFVYYGCDNVAYRLRW